MTWNRPGMATCFSFLETGPAKQSEHQPVRLGANWMLGDVRVDGRADVLRELASHGIHLSTDATSEELLLHAWQVWGESCLERVIGDFSFGSGMKRELCLWCARDFVRPAAFVLRTSQRSFCFSNTLEALRCTRRFPPIWTKHLSANFFCKVIAADLTRTVYSADSQAPRRSFS